MTTLFQIALVAIPLAMLTACNSGSRALSDATRLPTVTDCDPQSRDCRIELPGGGSLRVRFNDRPVRAMDEFIVDMQTAGGKVLKLVVDGVNMDMGFNEFIVEHVGEDVYRAQVLLPICIRKKMIWDLNVYVERNGQLFKVPFRFATRARR